MEAHLIEGGMELWEWVEMVGVAGGCVIAGWVIREYVRVCWREIRGRR